MPIGGAAGEVADAVAQARVAESLSNGPAEPVAFTREVPATEPVSLAAG